MNDFIGYVGLTLIQTATLPAIFGAISGGATIPIMMPALLSAGMLLLLANALINRNKLYIIANGLGLIGNLTLLGVAI